MDRNEWTDFYLCRTSITTKLLIRYGQTTRTLTAMESSLQSSIQIGLSAPLLDQEMKILATGSLLSLQSEVKALLATELHCKLWRSSFRMYHISVCPPACAACFPRKCSTSLFVHGSIYCSSCHDHPLVLQLF